MAGALAVLLDGGGSGVDAGNLVGLAGEKDRVVAEATAHVENRTVEAPGSLGFDNDRLSRADVPRNAGQIDALEHLSALVQGIEVHAVQSKFSGRRLIVCSFGFGTIGKYEVGDATGQVRVGLVIR